MRRAQGAGRTESSQSPPLGGYGCWAQVRQGFPASRVPGLSATRAVQSHVSLPVPLRGSLPPKGLVSGYLFFYPKSQKQFRRFHLWFHLLQQRTCRVQGKPRAVAAPRPSWPCGHLRPALLGHTPTPGLWAPSSTPLEPKGRCHQLGQEAGGLACLTFFLRLSRTEAFILLEPLRWGDEGAQGPQCLRPPWSRNSHHTGSSER